MFSTPGGLGKIVTVAETQAMSSVLTVHSLTHDKYINVRSKPDQFTCAIDDCVLLLPGKLVVTDWQNCNVKIVDVKEQSVVEDYILPDSPFHVIVLPHDQVAVTLPGINEIQLPKTKEKLTTLRKIKLNRWCWGIACNQDLLYVLCPDPNNVLVLDMQGSVQRDILLESALNETFSSPRCITISKNLQQMYISDIDSNMVAALTLQGQVTAVYKNDELKSPQGIPVLEDGSLMVCCTDNRTIHHISAGLTKDRIVAKGITNLEYICYDSDSKTIYVGSADGDHIRVFSLK